MKNNNKMFYITLMALLIMAIICSCKLGKNLKDWEFIESEEIGKRIIELEGTIYREDSVSNWLPTDRFNVEKIGESLYYCKKDVDNIFVVYETPGFENDEIYFCREETIFPPFSIEGIDSTGYKFPAFHSVSQDTYYKENRDVKIISDLFVCMENSEQVDYSFYSSQNKMYLVGEIVFYNDNLKGLEISRTIYAMGNKYWIDVVYNNEYAEISKEFLSEIAGISLPNANDYGELSYEEKYSLFGLEFDS